MPSASRPKPVRRVDPVSHDDGRCRCPWAGADPVYVAYHDTEWGVPEWDDRALFEKLILDGFQAGLSWITILRKREAFRLAFDGFVPETIVRYDEAKIARLMADAGIVRNKAKILNTIATARFFLAEQERDGFGTLLWSFVDGAPRQNAFRTTAEGPVESEASRAMAKHLKAQGLSFCGPTILYAFMQAVGMVNDHLVGCFRHEACRAMASR
ncbi:DNA-3-methyladenine glycosylase I [Lichenifustis flavocetrariae]|uniref:DNA-3-methyladenine glycosylase I n=1 Tax=Lichenifustis flavocetrariae TaxID=2949735 RepID=UPI0024A6DAFA|nr:DNA-3-methyladenine glycosylase I [Lichenifustis flavocetrariae]